MGRHALTQPLVTRPAYGEDEEEGSTVSEAKLPEGSPGGKGIPLDNGIPGSSTFAKPEDDIRDDKAKDESIFRVDGPGDMAKEQTTPDVNETNKDKHDGIGYGDHGPYDTQNPSKTKYPYRDDREHKHNASVLYVVETSKLAAAHELVVPAEGSTLKVATKLDPIETGLNPKMEERGKACAVTLKRADIPNLRWIFAVDCGNGPKTVRVKAERNGRATQMPKLDLKLSCSCPAWRWLGPEHHAKRETYIDGKPRGTASVPVIKDPEGINRVCKHVSAVLGKIRKWQIPSEKRRAVKQAMLTNPNESE